MLNRRAFLQHFGIGLAAACALASLPISAVEMLAPPEAAKRCAIEHLLAIYRAHVRGLSVSQHPQLIYVSPGLFAAYAGELESLQREIPESRLEHVNRWLMFKGARLQATPTLRDWNVAIAA